MTSESSKRIVRNTFFLYFRMLLTMGVSLYTIRVVLDTLGMVDYGIYNVVGGIVVMFSFLSITMSSASQRFLSFELGRNNIIQLKKTFSMTIIIYAMIAVAIFILAETVGLWFFITKMNIPTARIEAAHWVYQFSVFSFMMTMFTTPYHALIIAHEDMKVYAYISIFEVIMKLLIVYVLVFFSFDKLKLYAVLLFGVTTIITFIYRHYCKRKFIESRFSFIWDKSLFFELVGFSGWNLFGALSIIFNNHGINIILNIFFGPVVNAARGIAYQVNVAVNHFVQNFMTATRPQIIKYYAAGEKQQMLKLVFQSSKLSFLLLLVLSMPILLETEFVFGLWLKEIPDQAVLFTRLLIITALIDSLSYPLMTAAQATGKIKKYHAVVGSTRILNLPVSFIFLCFGFPPQTVFYIAIIISVICLFLRLWMLRTMVGLSMRRYVQNVIFKMGFVTISAYIIPMFIIYELKMDIIRFLIVGTVGLMMSVLTGYKLGLNMNERKYAANIIIKMFKKMFNKQGK